MGQVAARGEVQAEQALVAQRPGGPSLHCSGVSLYQSPAASESGPSAPRSLGHRAELDPRPQDGPEGDEVGVGAAVRLGIGVGRAEELAGPLVGQVLDRIDVVAAGVEPVMRDPLGVLVGQEVAHGALGGQGRVVLAGDQLDVAAAGRPAPGRSTAPLPVRPGPRIPGWRGRPGIRAESSAGSLVWK